MLFKDLRKIVGISVAAHIAYLAHGIIRELKELIRELHSQVLQIRHTGHGQFAVECIVDDILVYRKLLQDVIQRNIISEILPHKAGDSCNERILIDLIQTVVPVKVGSCGKQ